MRHGGNKKEIAVRSVENATAPVITNKPPGKEASNSDKMKKQPSYKSDGKSRKQSVSSSKKRKEGNGNLSDDSEGDDLEDDDDLEFDSFALSSELGSHLLNGDLNEDDEDDDEDDTQLHQPSNK
jgi:hypothetical protein